MLPLVTPPRKVYVAAALSEQGNAAKLALSLQDADFLVTSSWIRHDFSDRVKLGQHDIDEDLRKWGELDLYDLSRSDTLIVLSDRESTSGGYHVELGYFLASPLTKNIVVVGEKRNVFFRTKNVRHWDKSTVELVDWLKAQSGAAGLNLNMGGFLGASQLP